MLTRYTLKNISQSAGIKLPPADVFDLPEKVLQFGTVELLRGLPDYFIDKANRAGVFNGRIVVVKSTDNGDSSAFDKQDCLYTICVRGIENGEKIEENIVNSAISRILSARSEWGEILRCAHNPDLQLIISHDTEVGISFIKYDIWQSPPGSFPGKLLLFLYERYKAFNGSSESGMVIIPTELIPDNGRKLEALVLELAYVNGLEESFMDWLENSNYFCNSLVDRIVEGAPASADREIIKGRVNYKDELLIMAEVYRLWAIESSAEKVKKVLSFCKVDTGMSIAPDITKFRELKLRLLNGTQTLCCALALLRGYSTLEDTMQDEDFTGFMRNLMMNDIIPAITDTNISNEEAGQFAFQVLDRFRNPFIEYTWTSISVQYTSKMKMRNLPVLLEYYERYQSVPECFALGFAAYLLFMRAEAEGNVYKAEINGLVYTVQDDKAGYLSKIWKDTPVEDLVEKVLQDESLWGTDLTELKGFVQAVNGKLVALMDERPGQVIRNTITDKTVVQS